MRRTATSSTGSRGVPTTKTHTELKQRRGLVTRYDKPAITYFAGLHLAAIGIWLARGKETGRGLRGCG